MWYVWLRIPWSGKKTFHTLSSRKPRVSRNSQVPVVTRTWRLLVTCLKGASFLRQFLHQPIEKGAKNSWKMKVQNKYIQNCFPFICQIKYDFNLNSPRCFPTSIRSDAPDAAHNSCSGKCNCCATIHLASPKDFHICHNQKVRKTVIILIPPEIKNGLINMALSFYTRVYTIKICICIYILIYKHIITCKYTLVCPLLCSPELIFFGTSKKFRGASGVSWPWASTVSSARKHQALVGRVIHV